MIIKSNYQSTAFVMYVVVTLAFICLAGSIIRHSPKVWRNGSRHVSVKMASAEGSGCTRSDIWDHYTKSVNEGVTFGSCNYCKKLFKCLYGSTSSLRNHLKTVHTVVYTKLAEKEKKRKAETWKWINRGKCNFDFWYINKYNLTSRLIGHVWKASRCV